MCRWARTCVLDHGSPIPAAPVLASGWQENAGPRPIHFEIDSVASSAALASPPARTSRVEQCAALAARRATSTTPEPFAPRTPRSTVPSTATRTPSTTRSRPTPSLAVVRLMQSSALTPTPTRSARWTSRSVRVPPRSIVFAGAARARREIDRAVSLGPTARQLESPGELDRVDQRAVAQAPVRGSPSASIPMSMRKSRPHISTGVRVGADSACR